MKDETYAAYLRVLRQELVPAMGCTEPIAIAYAAAKTREVLGCMPERVTVYASGNLVKNVKSVIVPHTGGLCGIPAAAAAGIVAGCADAELEVLAAVTPAQQQEIAAFLQAVPIAVESSASNYVFDLTVLAATGSHNASVRICGSHTNIVEIKQDEKELFYKPYAEKETTGADREFMSVQGILQFADAVELADVAELLEKQITYNTAIAAEGLRGNWGAGIGKMLLETGANNVETRAKAYAAAGADARMGGCELPVVINSGSGNQGMTASLPVIIYAEALGASQAALYRALVVSNLVTIHLKTGIGRLSAYCGATSAGCGAAAGIHYLYGGGYRDIAHTIVNALAVNSGVICDGAKASCAAKIASAIEAGLLGMQMYRHGRQFYSGDGIVTKGVENTIRNVGLLARDGMRETDSEILKIMLHKV